jgi:hypothetical protein
MTELVHERLLEDLRDPWGTRYRRALVYAERQPAGDWVAWIEFVSAGGDRVVRTERETTQETLRAIVYWAVGLTVTYLDGALTRAFRRRAEDRVEVDLEGSGRLVHFRIITADAAVPLRVMAAPSLVPGQRRPVHERGAIVYVRTLEPAFREMPRIYEFLAHFQSEDAVNALGASLAADLGDSAVLEIRRREVAREKESIRDALVAARRRPD